MDSLTVKNNKSWSIELLRIVFTIIIIAHHYFTYSGSAVKFNGYLAVEFFFIVSGYLLAKKANDKNTSAVQYLINRIRRMYPMYILAIILTICFQLLTDGISSLSAEKLFNSALLIQSSGLIVGDSFNGTMWYISVLLILSFPVYAIVVSDSWKKIRPVMPLIVLFGYSFIENLDGGLETWSIQGGIYIPLLRGLLGLLIGCLVWDHRLEWMEIKRGGLKVFACILSIAVILICLVGSNKYECVAIGAMAVLLLSCLELDRTQISKKLSSFLNLWGGGYAIQRT